MKTNPSRKYYLKNLKKERKRRYDYFLSHRPDWQRRRLQKVYGISIEDYSKRLKKQRGVCAICKESPLKNLCVDHDHKTKKIRGLLCGKCNKGLGLLGDSLESLKKVLTYLESNEIPTKNNN